MRKGNKLKHLIETRILMPAYVGMLTGLIVRAVALVIQVAIPYDTWWLWLRILVEACAALGMVGCADVVLSVASGASAARDREIALTKASPQYLPNPRLSKEKYEREKLMLDAKRTLTLSGLEAERTKEWRTVLFCGAITVSYGLLFGMVIMKNANIISIATEVIGVAAIPYITWYLSAQYKEETEAAPEETAKALALETVDARLKAAKARFERGEETPADVGLLDTATEAQEYHNRLVKRLAVRQAGVKYLRTPEIYAFFGVEDASRQATIRRIVRQAGERGDYGVLQDPDTKQWLTPSGALETMFPPEKLARTPVASKRTRPPRYRTLTEPELAPASVNTVQEPNTDRASDDATLAPDGEIVPAVA